MQVRLLLIAALASSSAAGPQRQTPQQQTPQLQTPPRQTPQQTGYDYSAPSDRRLTGASSAALQQRPGIAGFDSTRFAQPTDEGLQHQQRPFVSGTSQEHIRHSGEFPRDSGTVIDAETQFQSLAGEALLAGPTSAGGFSVTLDSGEAAVGSHSSGGGTVGERPLPLGVTGQRSQFTPQAPQFARQEPLFTGQGITSHQTQFSREGSGVSVQSFQEDNQLGIGEFINAGESGPVVGGQELFSGRFVSQETSGIGRPFQVETKSQMTDESLASAQYAFKWDVNDVESGNFYGQEEERNGLTTRGKYYVALPDSRIMTVEYYADETGYHPKITYEGEARAFQPAVQRTDQVEGGQPHSTANRTQLLVKDDSPGTFGEIQADFQDGSFLGSQEIVGGLPQSQKTTIQFQSQPGNSEFQTLRQDVFQVATGAFQSSGSREEVTSEGLPSRIQDPKPNEESLDVAVTNDQQRPGIPKGGQSGIQEGERIYSQAGTRPSPGVFQGSTGRFQQVDDSAPRVTSTPSSPPSPIAGVDATTAGGYTLAGVTPSQFVSSSDRSNHTRTTSGPVVGAFGARGQHLTEEPHLGQTLGLGTQQEQLLNGQQQNQITPTLQLTQQPSRAPTTTQLQQTTAFPTTFTRASFTPSPQQQPQKHQSQHSTQAFQQTFSVAQGSNRAVQQVSQLYQIPTRGQQAIQESLQQQQTSGFGVPLHQTQDFSEQSFERGVHFNKLQQNSDVKRGQQFPQPLSSQDLHIDQNLQSQQAVHSDGAASQGFTPQELPQTAGEIFQSPHNLDVQPQEGVFGGIRQTQGSNLAGLSQRPVQQYGPPQG